MQKNSRTCPLNQNYTQPPTQGGEWTIKVGREAQMFMIIGAIGHSWGLGDRAPPENFVILDSESASEAFLRPFLVVIVSYYAPLPISLPEYA